MNKWIKRWENALDAFQKLKTLTKNVPAGTWTPEYRELASLIHSIGRDHFHTDNVVELLHERDIAQKGETPIEIAYRAMTDIQARLPHCPWCGRAFPGHCMDTCPVIRVYDAVRKDTENE